VSVAASHFLLEVNVKYAVFYLVILLVSVYCYNPFFPEYDAGELDILRTSFTDSSTVNGNDTLTLKIHYKLGRNFKSGGSAKFNIVSFCNESSTGWITAVDSLTECEDTTEIHFRADYSGFKCDYAGTNGFLVFEPDISFKYGAKTYQSISSGRRFHLFVKR
jgi:hypothetical protein